MPAQRSYDLVRIDRINGARLETVFYTVMCSASMEMPIDELNYGAFSRFEDETRTILRLREEGRTEEIRVQRHAFCPYIGDDGEIYPKYEVQ